MSLPQVNCNFCNKSFVNLSVLKNHQKTAKYCIELQKNSNQTNNNQDNSNDDQKEISYKCEYCEKEFTQKVSLKIHYGNCKIKKAQHSEEELKKLISKYEVEKEELKSKCEEELKLKYEKEMLELKQEIYKISFELEKEKEINEKLIEELKEYKNKFFETNEKLFENNDKLTDKLLHQPTSTTIYNDNSKNTTQQHIINYNKEFDRMTNELVPFSEEYIKNKIKEIVPINIIYSHASVVKPNSNIIDYNFACNIVNILKNNVFFTDTARGNLVYKDEDNNPIRESSEHFITDSVIKLCKPEIIDLCKRSLKIVKERSEEFTTEDYNASCLGIKELSECVNYGKPHAIITEISNRLSKNAKKLPSIKDFKNMLKNAVKDPQIIE